MTPAVPDPTVEALTEAERRSIQIEVAAMRAGHVHMRDMFAAVERILAARAAAPDALRGAVEELRTLSEAATPGPWEMPESIHGDPYINQVGRGLLSGGNVALCNTGTDDYGRANAQLIAAAVNLVRALLEDGAE